MTKKVETPVVVETPEVSVEFKTAFKNVAGKLATRKGTKWENDGCLYSGTNDDGDFVFLDSKGSEFKVYCQPDESGMGLEWVVNGVVSPLMTGKNGMTSLRLALKKAGANVKPPNIRGESGTSGVAIRARKAN